jgi:hypothetical protein
MEVKDIIGTYINVVYLKGTFADYFARGGNALSSFPK